MNELNELEMQLRSWVPRRPAKRLKRRIFSDPLPKEEPEPSFRLSWLPPATAALHMLCVQNKQQNNQAVSSAGANSMIAVALSNQSVAPWLQGSFSRVHNGIPASTFEWTNGSGSGIGSRSISDRTN